MTNGLVGLKVFTLAGAAPLFNQKETQDITTIRLDGMYTWCLSGGSNTWLDINQGIKGLIIARPNT